MANVNIDDLPAGTIDDETLFEALNAANEKVTGAQVKAYVGGSQDLQSVLDQGSIALATTAIELTSTEDILIRTYGAGKQVEIVNSVGTNGFGISDTNIWINSNGVFYPWPSAAPASNNYVLTAQTDGTLSWAAPSAGITIGTTTITSGTNTRVLYNNGGVVGEYAQVPVANGGTGAATLTGLLQGNGTSAFTAITDSSTVGQVLRVTGASTYAWGALDLADSDAVTGILPVANGGSGSSSVVWWALTGTSTLTGNVTIACGTNTLSFTSTAVENPFSFSATYTSDDSNDTILRLTGTLTSRGTSNDVISAFTIDAATANSTGTGVTHVGLRAVATASGTTNPANSIQILSVAMGSQSNAETFRGTSSAGITRQQFFGDGHFVFTQTTTGSEHAGTMATNAGNGAGVITESMQVSGSVTTAHTHFWRKMTGGVTTNATNNTFYSTWDNRSLVVNNTGFTGYGFVYQPVVTGTQSGTETLYAFTSSTGLWGVGTLTPAVSLDINGGFGNRDTANAQITSNQNDYAIGSGSSFLLNTDASRNITGITGGVNGKFLYIINNGSFNIVFTHQDASSTAANRIISSTAGNLTIAPNGSITLKYDATASRWRDIGVR